MHWPCEQQREKWSSWMFKFPPSSFHFVSRWKTWNTYLRCEWSFPSKREFWTVSVFSPVTLRQELLHPDHLVCMWSTVRTRTISYFLSSKYAKFTHWWTLGFALRFLYFWKLCGVDNLSSLACSEQPRFWVSWQKKSKLHLKLNLFACALIADAALHLLFTLSPLLTQPNALFNFLTSAAHVALSSNA